MYINRRRIIKTIENCIEEGETRFVIFPYGKWGKLVKSILNEVYGIFEIGIIDNILAKDVDEIMSIEEVKNIEGEFTILFATDNQQVRNQLLKQIDNLTHVKVLDIASVEGIYFPLDLPKMDIEECDDLQRKAVFEKTKNAWRKLGEVDPYWSVITSDEYRMNNIDEVRIKEFYKTGYKQCISIIKTLKRTGIIEDESDSKKLEITEIGCGVGRVTKSLAECFAKVHAFDISEGNMSIAKKMIADKNVNFCLVKSLEEYEDLPKTDIVYSIIVLQHNCPAVIEYMLEKMFASLKKNGVCIFQVPTYKEDYEFKYDDYIRNSKEEMEMHVLPQKKIFEIAYKQRCMPMEVYQDALTGMDDFSTTFVFKKL